MAPRSLLLMLLLLAVSVPVHAACTANNPNANLIELTPTSDFAAFGTADVTVIHDKTGLMWKRCSEGQTWDSSSNTCAGTATTMTWDNALKTANTANTAAFAGFTDWRLPSIKELESILELCGSLPPINLTAFPGTPVVANYWSSSSYFPDVTRAWLVIFGNGDNFGAPKTDSGFARLVRDVSPSASVAPIPTLSASMLGLLMALLVLTRMVAARRRR